MKKRIYIVQNGRMKRPKNLLSKKWDKYVENRYVVEAESEQEAIDITKRKCPHFKRKLRVEEVNEDVR